MRFAGRSGSGSMEASSSYKPITTAVEGDMCPSAVALRAQVAKDNLTAMRAQLVEPDSQRYSLVSPTAERRRLREETPVAGGSGDAVGSPGGTDASLTVYREK
eukprot:16452062-Heterocapsa_arctica.AAC.1